MSPCHSFLPGSCIIRFQLKNTGPGCAVNVHGMMTQYRETTSQPLVKVASTHFTVPHATVAPNEILVVNARFSAFSFNALGNGEYCPFVFIEPSWDDVACP